MGSVSLGGLKKWQLFVGLRNQRREQEYSPENVPKSPEKNALPGISYPLPKALLKMMFLFLRWDMLVFVEGRGWKTSNFPFEMAPC